MNNAGRISGLVAKRIVYLARVQELAAEGFEFVDDARYVVRRASVVGYVARRLGVDPSPALYLAVLAAVKGLSFEPTKAWNRSLYRKVKPRDMSAGQALEASELLRKKPSNVE